MELFLSTENATLNFWSDCISSICFSQAPRVIIYPSAFGDADEIQSGQMHPT